MKLREKQSKFVLMIAQLINYADSIGYDLTFGDAYRDPRVFGKYGEKKGYGSTHSQHKHRLAVDFNLFIDGKYKNDTESYKPLGEYWESLGMTWGGRFTRKDGNHFQY